MSDDEYMKTRGVGVPEGLWAALKMVADLKRTSVSAELRDAATAHIARYGLTVTKGEVVHTIDAWQFHSPAHSNPRRRRKSTAEEDPHGRTPGTSLAEDPATPESTTEAPA